MDTLQLIQEMTRVREALERMPQQRRPISLANFPSGSCGDTCLVVGTYLHEVCGLPLFDYVCGERGSQVDNSWTSHAWLKKDDLIVDITADQFPDGPGKVIVAEHSLWHQQFETEVPRPASLTLYAPQEVYALLGVYSWLRQSLGPAPASAA